MRKNVGRTLGRGLVAWEYSWRSPCSYRIDPGLKGIGLEAIWRKKELGSVPLRARTGPVWLSNSPRMRGSVPPSARTGPVWPSNLSESGRTGPPYCQDRSWKEKEEFLRVGGPVPPHRWTGLLSLSGPVPPIH